jgi:hypothetical protein
MANCPNCHKPLHWVPKGKHTCLCGEVIETDGKDLLDVDIAMINVPVKAEWSIDAKILIGLSIIFVFAGLAVRMFLH